MAVQQPSHKTTHSVKLQVPLGAVLEQAKFPVQFSNRPRTEDQTSTSGHRSATANERDRVAAIHERLLDNMVRVLVHFVEYVLALVGLVSQKTTLYLLGPIPFRL